MALASPVFLDATVLSNFASTGSVWWLVDLLDVPSVTPTVQGELASGAEHGHEFLASALDAFDDGIRVVDRRNDGRIDAAVERAGERLDAGEAETVVYAEAAGGTMATDDLAARTVAAERGVPVTGSVGLLVRGIERGVLDTETANEWLRTWREKRDYYAPVERVEEVIDPKGGAT